MIIALMINATSVPKMIWIFRLYLSAGVDAFPFLVDRSGTASSSEGEAPPPKHLKNLQFILCRQNLSVEAVSDEIVLSAVPR